MATSQENTSILTSADPKEEEKKEEEEKPLLDLQIDSDADGGSPALPSPPPVSYSPRMYSLIIALPFYLTKN